MLNTFDFLGFFMINRLEDAVYGTLERGLNPYISSSIPYVSGLLTF